jgi:hypothetical protein
MAVTLTAEVQVDTKDLRNALRAVTPHAEPNKTGDLDDEHRVRLVIDDYHVNVLASNGSTAVMALVSIEEDTRRKALDVDDGPLIVDLTPRQCRLILQQFKAKATDPEGVDQIAALRVLKNGEGLEVADVSGLFAGESVRFPGVGVSEKFPDVIGVITRALAAASAAPSPKPLTTGGDILALFAAASKAYDQPLTVEATGTPESRGFLVSCGESFLGVISSRHQDDDSLRKRDGWRHGWIRRLGLADPVREAERELAGV